MSKEEEEEDIIWDGQFTSTEDEEEAEEAEPQTGTSAIVRMACMPT